jgi:hypothetical protein
MNHDLFSRTRTPRPPADLRERTLRAARAAAREASAPLSAGWGFNRLDLVWVAALLLLVAANVTFTRSKRPSTAASASADAPAAARQLERELGMKGRLVVAAGRDGDEDGKAQRQLMRELEGL